MIITNGTTPTIVFVLVNAANGTEGVDGIASEITVKMSKNGSTLAPIDVSITGIGDGWYTFPLDAGQTDTDGPLIITARADGTLTWRDLHEVVTQPEAVLNEGVYNRIADHVLRRNFADVSENGHGDDKTFRSLLGSVAKDVNRVELVGTTLNIYEADDARVLGRQTVSVNHNASPIVGVDTDDTSGGAAADTAGGVSEI